MEHQNNSRIISFKNEHGKLTNVQGVCRIIDIYSNNSLPLFGRMDRVNYENEIELIQRSVWEYDDYEKPISGYMQYDSERIEIYTNNNLRTIYKFDDEYNNILNKIDSIQYSFVIKYFDNMEL